MFVLSSSLAWPSNPEKVLTFPIAVKVVGVAVPDPAVIVLPVVSTLTAKVFAVLSRTVNVKPLSSAASAPVSAAKVTTSPLLKPCADEVRMVGLPTATPVMLFAPPDPVAICTILPCAEIAVDAIVVAPVVGGGCYVVQSEKS